MIVTPCWVFEPPLYLTQCDHLTQVSSHHGRGRGVRERSVDQGSTEGKLGHLPQVKNKGATNWVF